MGFRLDKRQYHTLESLGLIVLQNMIQVARRSIFRDLQIPLEYFEKLFCRNVRVPLIEGSMEENEDNGYSKLFYFT